jgi:hypothetical protein
MSEVQEHGFIFEDWVKGVLGVKHLATNYTQKWDVAKGIPVSVKFMGMKNAVEFGSAVRIYEIDEPFILVIGRWKQDGNLKYVRSIDEIVITPEILRRMRGDITLAELREFDEKIKSFPPGKEGQAAGSFFARKWKSERKSRKGLLTITHKIDSKDQRRVQCNLNYTNYIKLFGEPSRSIIFRSQKFDQPIAHASRVFKAKN